MLSVRLDPDLEQLLERDVDDLARYNILRFLHDNPRAEGDVRYFADELGLRSMEWAGDALDALADSGLLTKLPAGRDHGCLYRLSADPFANDLVDRLYHLGSSGLDGEIVERLAARSLHKARKAQAITRNGRRNGHK